MGESMGHSLEGISASDGIHRIFSPTNNASFCGALELIYPRESEELLDGLRSLKRVALPAGDKLEHGVESYGMFEQGWTTR